MQALILVGGQGTRLQPLTLTMPKPVVPLAGQPFIAYMLQWLRRHGVDDVIMSCGFMAQGMRSVLGDGAELGLRVRYIEEPEPLGTGGALKYAEGLLDERFFMLNGDVLTDIDLTAQLAQHQHSGAVATLALTAVNDPSAYGLVRRHADLSVREFVEKPGPEQIDTNLINAGAYILQRSVLEMMGAAGTNISIEREVFPALVGHGLFGYEAAGYWLDIGTPERYLQATFDILEGNVATEVGERVAASGGAAIAAGEVQGKVIGPSLLAGGCRVASGAIVGVRAVLGEGVSIAEGAHVENSVLLEGASVGAQSVVSGSIIGPRGRIGEHCRIDRGVVLGEGVAIGSENILTAGARIFPGVQLPDRAIRF